MRFKLNSQFRCKAQLAPPNTKCITNLRTSASGTQNQPFDDIQQEFSFCNSLHNKNDVGLTSKVFDTSEWYVSRFDYSD